MCAPRGKIKLDRYGVFLALCMESIKRAHDKKRFQPPGKTQMKMDRHDLRGIQESTSTRRRPKLVRGTDDPGARYEPVIPVPSDRDARRKSKEKGNGMFAP